MNDILSMDLNALSSAMKEMGMPGFKAKQIFSWLHDKCALGFDEMSNISVNERTKLSERYYIGGISVLKKVESSDGTRKYLLKLYDGNIIEAVVLKYKHGATLCMSSQVGCAMGCTFCASTIGGLVRNLTVGELLGQVYLITREIGERLSNIVMMGSGEPLHNYDNVLAFLKAVNLESGYNMSHRNITLSTCGLVKEMKMLASEKLQITLAISLHAPDDARRTALMPINSKYHVKEVVKAAQEYFEATGRRVTFEYALIQNVNDTPQEANKLATLLKGINCHINLIPINEVKENEFYPTKNENIFKFRDILKNLGINVTIRRELGSDINAACGQLRNSQLDTVNIEKSKKQF